MWDATYIRCVGPDAVRGMLHILDAWDIYLKFKKKKKDYSMIAILSFKNQCLAIDRNAKFTESKPMITDRQVGYVTILPSPGPLWRDTVPLLAQPTKRKLVRLHPHKMWKAKVSKFTNSNHRCHSSSLINGKSISYAIITISPREPVKDNNIWLEEVGN